MKKEARVLFVKECRKGYAFVVYRGEAVEETSIYFGNDLRKGLQKLRTIGEIRYFYCINCSNTSVFGSFGLRSMSFSSIEPCLLERTKTILDVLCCIVDMLGKTMPNPLVVYICSALSKSY